MKRKIFKNRVGLYIFFGGLTVLVNLICFCILTKCFNWSVDLSNVLSIIIALLFAYVTNTRYVFCSKCDSVKERFYEFLKFVSARIFTMILEIVGVHIMVNILLWDSVISKIMLQVIVVVLNYIFSKMIVYKSS